MLRYGLYVVVSSLCFVIFHIIQNAKYAVTEISTLTKSAYARNSKLCPGDLIFISWWSVTAYVYNTVYVN